MTKEQLLANKDQFACFYCFSNLGQYAHVLIVDTEADLVEIKNAKAVVVPMVFCSSDCMYLEHHLRYTQRINDGTFRQVNPRTLRENELPTRWQGEATALV